MSKAGPFLALAAVAVAIGVAGSGKKRRKGGGVIVFDDEPVSPGGDEPQGDEQVDGGSNQIVNFLNVAPTSKRVGSRVPWAVVLHQMGFSRGSDPYKYTNVTAHYIILPDGTIVQLHPVTAYLNAAQGFNQGGISIEFAGNFPSVAQSTNPNHFWNPGKMGMNQLTPEQVMSGRWLVEYLHDLVLPEIGADLTAILAHRQSGQERQNDPGPDVWANVGQWAVDNLGLSDGGPDFTVGAGNPIKQEWRDAPLIV